MYVIEHISEGSIGFDIKSTRISRRYYDFADLSLSVLGMSLFDDISRLFGDLDKRSW